MPNRRAFRPDSQYYRTTRRQSLRRGGGAAAAGRGLTFLVLAAACAMLVWWGVHGGLWAAIFAVVGLIVVIATGVLVMGSGRR
jgi:Flp pilus assembly protein TadB